MEILGVGPLEIMFILIIALIVMGPQDMVNTGKTIGRFLRRLITSPTWRTVQQTSRELKYLPNRLIREAGVEEEMKEIEKLGKEIEKDLKNKPEFTKELEQAAKEIDRSLSAWTSPVISERDLNIPTPTPPSPQIVNTWTTPPDHKSKELSPAAPAEEPGEIHIQTEKPETEEIDTAEVELLPDGSGAADPAVPMAAHIPTSGVLNSDETGAVSDNPPEGIHSSESEAN